jgi:hypothetical protein
MKRWGTVLLFLMLSGCQGPDQHIVNRCEATKNALGLNNSYDACTCFRDNIKKSLDRKTYLEVSSSALGNDADWEAHVRSLKPEKREQVATSIVTAALTCQAFPWDELPEPLLPGTT